MRIGRAIFIGVAFAASSAAQASEWWYILSDSTTRPMEFVDAQSVRRVGASVSLTVMRVDRAGHVHQGVERLTCGTRAVKTKPLADFACEGVEHRMSSAMLLGSLTPVQASRFIADAGNASGAGANLHR